MATMTTRTGDTGQNFQQITAGETPNSVEVSLNAKGAAQVSIKLYFSTPAEVEAEVANNLSRILHEVKGALAAQGIALAGQEGK